jgi:CheY-like chemotaxis protein
MISVLVVDDDQIVRATLADIFDSLRPWAQRRLCVSNSLPSMHLS